MSFIKHTTLGVTLAVVLTACFSLPNTQKTSPTDQITHSTHDWYRTYVDNLEITALSAGTLMNKDWFDGEINPTKYTALLAKTGIKKQADGIPTAITSFLINDGKQLILIDAADNMSGNPETLKNTLAKAGVSADKITTILLTHTHPDHITGLHDKNGKVLFPNATLYYSEHENVTNPQGYTVNLKDYKTQTFADGETLLGSVTTIPLKGHTAGHTGFGFTTDDGHKVLFIGDIIHNLPVQFARPDVSTRFDIDKAQAAVSRQQILDTAAERKILIAGAHINFPSLGYVTKTEYGYDWQALK